MFRLKKQVLKTVLMFTDSVILIIKTSIHCKVYLNIFHIQLFIIQFSTIFHLRIEVFDSFIVHSGVDNANTVTATATDNIAPISILKYQVKLHPEPDSNGVVKEM